jgi:hypothetical protein
MPWSPCRFVKQLAEFVPKKDRINVPDNTRGIYALLRKQGKDRFDVVYVGKSGRSKTSGIYARLKDHVRSKWFKWTHFTIFEVHDNITDQEITELEGLFRHMYRKDSGANKQNRQLCHKAFKNRKVQVSEKRLRKWNWPQK